MTITRQAATPEEAAYVFLEQAKQELVRDKELIPLAVLVYGTGHEQTYDLTALIITVAPATFGRIDDGKPWRDCIFVTRFPALASRP